MIGVYDFCGHYEWTFSWLEKMGGENLLHEFWDEAIHQDSQRHAAQLILEKGIEGMKEYWGHTLAHEGAGYTTVATKKKFRIDIQNCPSKGFLIRNKLEQHLDYCDHCIGWIGPMLKRAGFTIDHQHNHCGQCWWEMHRQTDETKSSAPGELEKENDVRLASNWLAEGKLIDTFVRANSSDEKSDGSIAK
jgi:hypothetical protein